MNLAKEIERELARIESKRRVLHLELSMEAQLSLTNVLNEYLSPSWSHYISMSMEKPKEQ